VLFKVLDLIYRKKASHPSPVSVPLLGSFQASTGTFNVCTLLVRLTNNYYTDHIKRDEMSKACDVRERKKQIFTGVWCETGGERPLRTLGVGGRIILQ
jgi:hypothetical protein